MVNWISPKLLMGLSESEFLIVHDPYFSPDLQLIKTLGGLASYTKIYVQIHVSIVKKWHMAM